MGHRLCLLPPPLILTPNNRTTPCVTQTVSLFASSVSPVCVVCLRWFKVGLLSGLLHAAVGPTYRFAKIPFLFLDFYVKMKRSSRGIGRSDKTVMFLYPLWGLNPSLIAAPNLWCGTSGQASRNLSASRLQSLNPDWLQIEWKRVRDEQGFADALVLTLVRQDLKISRRCIGGLQFPLEGAAWCQIALVARSSF